MLEDIVFKIEDVTSSNLSELSGELSAVMEQRLLEISDVAESAVGVAASLVQLGFDAVDALNCLFRGALEDIMPQIKLPEDIREHITSKLYLLGNTDKAAFCEELIRRLAARGVRLTESHILPPSVGEDSFTYVRNALSDEAFEVFTENRQNATVVYSESFRECVRKVLSGECTYCLLPLEESGGVRIPGVIQLIYGNELKINSVTPVFGFDGNAGVKFAMVSRGFSSEGAKKGDDRYLEIKLSHDGESSLINSLSAAYSLGLSLYRVNTLVFDGEGEQQPVFSVIFRDGGKGFLAFLVYLMLFADDFTAIGLFKNLE